MCKRWSDFGKRVGGKTAATAEKDGDRGDDNDAATKRRRNVKE